MRSASSIVLPTNTCRATPILVVGVPPCRLSHLLRYWSVALRKISYGALLMMLIFWVAGQAAPSGVATPYQSGGCGRCTGGMTIGTSMGAREIEGLGGQPAHQHLEGFHIKRRRVLLGDPEIGHFKGGNSAPDAELGPAAAHLVEHVDFFD